MTSQDNTASWTDRTRAVIRRITDRPLLVVVLIGCAFVAYQWWWIDHARLLGALDVDEAGSIATSLDFHRAATEGPLHLLNTFLGTGNGPLVPLLAVPLIAVFGRSATTPIFIQPLLVLLSAVGVAGCVRHLVGRAPAIVTGCATLAMPALITSSRTDQFSNGVGAAMCLGAWALLSSRRLERTWPVIAFGVACGAMTISRTMSVSFLPAMVVAALIVGDLRSPKAWRNLGLAAAAALVIAVPWWWSQWDYVSSYLLSSGYGGQAHFFGSTDIVGRLGDTISYLGDHLRLFLPIGVFVTVLGAGTAVTRIRHAPRAFFDRNRELIALWASICVGFAALMTSANRGVWFSTPLESLLVGAVVATGVRTFRSPAALHPIPLIAAFTATMFNIGNWTPDLWVFAGFVAVPAAALALSPARRCSMVAGVLTVGLCLMAVWASTPLTGPGVWPANVPLRIALVRPIELYIPTAYENDARFSAADLGTRRRAADAWSDAARHVVRRLDVLARDLGQNATPWPVATITGSRALFNTNVVWLAQQLSAPGGLSIEAPRTFETNEEGLRHYVTPTVNRTPRVLVAIEGRTPPFPNDLNWQRLVALAERSGWQVDSSILLPDGGRVVIYTHPDSARDRSTRR